MNKLPIYMDYSSTTPIDPMVLEAMMIYMKEEYGNPGSRTHAYGWTAEAAVETARKNVADLIGAISALIIAGLWQVRNSHFGFSNVCISFVVACP